MELEYAGLLQRRNSNGEVFVTFQVHDKSQKLVIETHSRSWADYLLACVDIINTLEEQEELPEEILEKLSDLHQIKDRLD